ncbi:MAG TPA: hypothetical protein VFL61_00255 [Gaiellaceae bacterium]|nr:hypothetical protein [Gaiellaceae bacterium]
MTKKLYWKTEAGSGPTQHDGGADWFFTGPDSDARDVSKPVAYDGHGRSLYAPRGITVRPGAEHAIIARVILEALFSHIALRRAVLESTAASMTAATRSRRGRSPAASSSSTWRESWAPR